jgi:hypothetical protein
LASIASQVLTAAAFALSYADAEVCAIGSTIAANKNSMTYGIVIILSAHGASRISPCHEVEVLDPKAAIPAWKCLK